MVDPVRNRWTPADESRTVHPRVENSGRSGSSVGETALV
ncbi:MAG: hypothetical protein J07HX64_01028 [halophilic archaeon J07HX64]|nr:MAG: hypothetical protein J07HX64_01028 [halophilic archaeon J07HX64]